MYSLNDQKDGRSCGLTSIPLFRNSLILLFTFLFAFQSIAQEKPKVYFLPGMGGDHRLFKNLDLEPYDAVILEYPLPEEGTTVEAYAKRLMEQMDTSKPFSLVGVSQGGILAVEISKMASPEQIILISSVKTTDELPLQYRIMRKLPLNHIVSGELMIKLSSLGRRLFEPAAWPEEETFEAMINAKHPLYLERLMEAIVHWDNYEYPEGLLHIHGEKDHTLASKNIKDAIFIDSGSHMIVMMNPEIIDFYLRTYLL